MNDFIPAIPAKPITHSLLESISLVMEAKKKIGEYTNGSNVSKVYKLSGEHNEGDPYVVHLHKDGKHYEPADYFTNDEEDAHVTAKHMVKEAEDVPSHAWSSYVNSPYTHTIHYVDNEGNSRKTGWYGDTDDDVRKEYSKIMPKNKIIKIEKKNSKMNLS